MSICVCNNANATYEISTTIYANTYIDLYISTHTQLICLQCKSHCKRMYYIYIYVCVYVRMSEMVNAVDVNGHRHQQSPGAHCTNGTCGCGLASPLRSVWYVHICPFNLRFASVMFCIYK